LQKIDGATEQRRGAIVGIRRAAGNQGGIHAGFRNRDGSAKSGRAAADHDDIMFPGRTVHLGTIGVSGGIFKPAGPGQFARQNAATADVQIEAIPDSSCGQMDQTTQQESLASPRTRLAAFSVHIFTAMGAGVALIALLEAVREHWAAMFAWLGVALVIDAVDGPIARRLDVMRVLPNWSGEVLDLVVDFVTYVFLPAFAITASGLLLPLAAPLLGAGIAISGALYFADRRMKAPDNHFRGFPALWNVAAFYLFLLHPKPALASLLVAILIALTFVPFHVLHPIRVVRLRWLTLSLLAIWAVLAAVTVAQDFNVAAPVTVSLCAIGAYMVGSDAAIRLARSFSA
jgi:phosphatidylcholine synthase